MNAFNALVSAVTDMDLDPDKAVALLENIIRYRDVVQGDYDRVSGALDFFKGSNEVLMAQNGRLIEKVIELEKALAATKEKTITLDMSAAFNKAGELQERFIDFIKWLQREAVVLSDGEKIDLYTAKFIGSAFFAKYGFMEMNTAPFRGEGAGVIKHCDSRGRVLQFVKTMLEFNYPGYKLVDLDETLWSKE